MKTNIYKLLKQACEDFIYYDNSLKSWTIVAGIPHFDQRCGAFLCNWGRDTMISCPGIFLATQKWNIFRLILENYLRFIHNGLLPNFIGDGSSPRYNSVDATLWLFWTIEKYLQYTKDYSFFEAKILRKDKIQTAQKILEEILDSLISGISFDDTWQEEEKQLCTKISIYRDNIDSLLVAGSKETQLTWMDARPKASLPITSRHGKAVEINALWYNALRFMGIYSPEKKYKDLAENVKKNYKKFWNPEQNCLYDTIEGDERQGQKVRPNQIFSIVMGLWENPKERIAIMDKVSQDLFTPYGLRTLPSYDPDYKAVHTDESSYHQGTIWPWLTGGFVEACILTYNKEKTIQILEEKQYFSSLPKFLEELSSIPEILDGSCSSAAQWNRKGCPKQAWSVAENYRAIQLFQWKHVE
ncbi:MAG: hypothetical protein HUU50_06380 [Candidatus Brocadiae bacterium]|nr:hypothetical protein [Candidatus Brocadiia bacterium]